MKRSQVTMFIIVGLVILIIIAFLLFIRAQAEKEQIKRNIEVIGTLFEKQGKYNSYVRECVEQGTKEAVLLAGMQGGAIYDYQAEGGKPYLGPEKGYPYGRHVLPYSYQDRIYNVSYGIRAPELGSLHHPNVPFYPYGLTKLVTNPTIISPFYVNVFGNFPANPFTPLCDYHGSNRRELSHTVACETYDSRSVHDGNSVQEYLERYIETYASACIRLESLPELSRYTVEKGNASAAVTFAERSIIVDFQMPISISFGDMRSVVNLRDFSITLDNRLKRIHELATRLIDRDVNDIYFNIVRDANKLQDCRDIGGGFTSCLKPGMSVSKSRNVCLGTGLCTEGNYDNILIITDEESLIDGRPYRFQFAIQNRIPALDLIRTAVGTGSFMYDYVVFPGDTITILPFGIDPDEDLHNTLGFMDGLYHYSLWKETYDQIYDPAGGCPVHDPACQRIIPHALNEWTRSDDFSSTRRIASYTTGSMDLGIHEVKVEVCDEANLCDYQVVIILVINGSFAGGANNYEDIDDRFASMEDPFTLVSPMTHETLGLPSAKYSWRIYGPGGGLVWSGDTVVANKSIPLPPWEILTIRSMVTAGPPAFFSTPGDYVVNLDIYTPEGDLALANAFDNTLTVKQCLPHRHPSPAFPYNTTDGFQANHSCCAGENPEDPLWGTYLGSSSICYSEVEWGCRDDPSFRDFSDFTGSSSLVYNDRGFSSPGYYNDVYMRVFNRYCDGTRGNVCLGRMVDTRTHFAECGGCERCEYASDSCTNIPYGEFVCSEEWKCSLGDAQPYLTPGPMACQATCALGECNTSINCFCTRQDCGAACENDTSFTWAGTLCEFNCNDHMKVHGDGSYDCTYHSGEYTVCSSPDPDSSWCFTHTIGEESYLLCPSDWDYTEPLYSRPELVAHCRRENTCYYGTQCTADGPSHFEGESCHPAGTAINMPGYEDICYYNAGGNTWCNADGSCSYSSSWSIPCTGGDPAAHGYCVFGGSCYHSILCDSNLGWQSVGPVSCGHYEESGTCYYGGACRASGCAYSEAQMVCTDATATCTATGVVCV